MKKGIKIARITVIFGLIIGGAFIGYRSFINHTTPSCFFVTADQILSKEGLSAIATFIKEETDYKKSSLAIIAYKLKAAFSHINHIAISHISKKLVINVQPHKPRFVINADKVLLESGKVKPRSLFNNDILLTIPLLTISESACHIDNLSADCFNALNTISPVLLEQYNLCWENEREVWLTDKKKPHFTILTDSHSITHQQKLDVCGILKKTIESRKDFSRRKSTVWVADIRFDNQVIIFSRGGKGHGYNTLT